MKNLQAILTGAASGIGLATARLLLRGTALENVAMPLFIRRSGTWFRLIHHVNELGV